MASTEYTLADNAWTDCGAADDCTIQSQGAGVVIFTTAATLPVNTPVGLRLTNFSGSNNDAAATIQRPGMKLWARAARGSVSVSVER